MSEQKKVTLAELSTVKQKTGSNGNPFVGKHFTPVQFTDLCKLFGVPATTANVDLSVVMYAQLFVRLVAEKKLTEEQAVAYLTDVR